MLYALSIPWYRSAGPASGTLLGLPDWVATALLCYALAAVLNACAWLLTDVADETPPAEADPTPRSGAVEAAAPRSGAVNAAAPRSGAVNGIAR